VNSEHIHIFYSMNHAGKWPDGQAGQHGAIISLVGAFLTSFDQLFDIVLRHPVSSVFFTSRQIFGHRPLLPMHRNKVMAWVDFSDYSTT
jgi:uncharacterized NAD(P)/FAD-binding protein YdhS